jgi:AhpD family alkylhydroperoxidase
MPAFIEPPARPALWLRPLLWLAERIAGKPLLPARVMSWSPRTALGSGVLEVARAMPTGRADSRLLKLVRLQVSFAVACPFCIDMNSDELESARITPAELAALQAGAAERFAEHERAALRYALALCRTPIVMPVPLLQEVRALFTEKERVTLAATVAQVNHWARLIQGLGLGAPELP